MFENLSSGFIDILKPLWFVISHGGFIAIILVIIYILYTLYRYEITGQFIKDQQWVFLNIRVPKENLVSTLAIEQIYAQMHALMGGLTFAQIYVEGRIQLWYSLEIVSLGGKISFIIRAPKDMRNLVEAAFYSQYPTAEITEVADYLENIEYDPETSEFDLWGTEYKFTMDDVSPIKTYKDFEHTNSEQKIIDPLGPLFEGLAKMEPHEFFGIQILIQPLADDEWQPSGAKKAKELLGEKIPSKTGILDLLLSPLYAFANFKFSSLLEAPAKVEEKKDKNNLLSMTEVEKERVQLIQRKISKPGYKTKIRHLYIAPKDKYDGAKKAMIIGVMRSLGSSLTNGFKPDTKQTWTDFRKYKISPSLEQGYINKIIKQRKGFMFKGYKERSIQLGISALLLNVEELATIYHLPVSITPNQATVATVDSKKSQPPIDLPVGDF